MAGLTTAICNSAKLEIIQGIHLAADVYKIALVKTAPAGTYDKNTTNVGTPGSGAPTTANLGTDEMAGTGYTSGGLTLTSYSAVLTADTASIDWADAVWTTATFSSDGAIIYNSTRANRAIQIIAFADSGSIPVVSTAANFTVQIPSSGTGQIRLT
jgi:hypothetical protein